MLAFIKIINSVSAIGIVVLVLACSASSGTLVVEPHNRSVSIYTAQSVIAEEPMLVFSVPIVSPTTADSVTHVGKTWLTKIELDFGDNSGWIDATLRFQTYVWAGSDPNYMRDHAVSHTYANPGSYTITARATFWDGEVITTDEDGFSTSATVTVPHI